MDPNLITWLRNKTKRHDTQLADIMHKFDSDFLVSIAYQKEFIGEGVASGTTYNSNGSVKHPGVATYKSSTSANSGYRYHSDSNSIVLAGGEKFIIIFETATQLVDVVRRSGFHNASTPTAPTEGVYLEIDGGVLAGCCTKGNTNSTTESTFSVSANTWYKGVVELNADATLATFKLYADDGSTLLWSDTLATNIPIVSVGCSDILTFVNSGAALTVLGYTDYMCFILPNARRV